MHALVHHTTKIVAKQYYTYKNLWNDTNLEMIIIFVSSWPRCNIKSVSAKFVNSAKKQMKSCNALMPVVIEIETTALVVVI